MYHLKTYIANKLFNFVMKNATIQGKMIKDTLITLTKIKHVYDTKPKSVETIYIDNLCNRFLQDYGLDEISEKRFISGLIENPQSEIQGMEINNGCSNN